MAERARGFFFGTTETDEVGRFPVSLGGEHLDELEDLAARTGGPPGETRFLLVPVREGTDAVTALRAEAERLERTFAVDSALSADLVGGLPPFPEILRRSGFVKQDSSTWRLDRPGRLPAIVSAWPAWVIPTAFEESKAGPVNLAFVALRVLSGYALPTRDELEALARFVARLDRSPTEVRRRFDPGSSRIVLP